MRYLLTCLLALLVAACAEPPSDEARIRANIETMENALAERNAGDFMAQLSPGFRGGHRDRQDLDRDAAKAMLGLYLLRYREVRVLVSQIAVTIDPYQPELASSTALVALAGGEQWLPRAAGAYTVTGDWRNFDGEWLLTRLVWE